MLTHSQQQQQQHNINNNTSETKKKQFKEYLCKHSGKEVFKMSCKQTIIFEKKLYVSLKKVFSHQIMNASRSLVEINCSHF
jgi:hypothetical protein